MKRFKFIAIFFFICQSLFSQYQIGIVPRLSPDKGVSQKIGFTEINIKYGSPSIKSREVWGDLVPYDKVWRAGANNATTIEFSTDVIIKNTTIEAGKYAFFIIPKKHSKWIAVLSKDAAQWGSFKYNQKDDAIRIEILPRKNTVFKEDLNYRIENYGFDSGEILLEWEYLQFRIEFSTNYIHQFEKTIESRRLKVDKNIQWIVYLQGAEHLENIDARLELAKNWIEQSELLLKEVSEWNEQFYPKKYIVAHLFWTKAKILAKLSQYKEAIDSAEKMKTLDPDELFYSRENSNQEIDVLIEKWKKNKS